MPAAMFLCQIRAVDPDHCSPQTLQAATRSGQRDSHLQNGGPGRGPHERRPRPHWERAGSVGAERHQRAACQGTGSAVADEGFAETAECAQQGVGDVWCSKCCFGTHRGTLKACPHSEQSCYLAGATRVPKHRRSPATQVAPSRTALQARKITDANNAKAGTTGVLPLTQLWTRLAATAEPKPTLLGWSGSGAGLPVRQERSHVPQAGMLT